MMEQIVEENFGVFTHEPYLWKHEVYYNRRDFLNVKKDNFEM